MGPTTPLLQPGVIGRLEPPNRIIRAATSEAMAGPEGEVTEELIGLHEALARDGEADFLYLARPLIREPDLVRQLEAGRTGMVDCTSSNICVMHMAIDPLRCWRRPRWHLLEHGALRLSGRLSPKRLDG